MENTDTTRIANLLRQSDVLLAPGLTDAEVGQVQERFGFRFPPDLRALLQYALPVSPECPNWRDESEESLRWRLGWPRHGILSDVEHDAFWVDEWGPRPADISAAIEVASQEIARAPVLIPVYSHRYIPDEPHLSGNPVFSVYHTDIIYYGANLAEYFANEFLPLEDRSLSSDIREIKFWRRVMGIY
jgi:hypothetical protein